MFEEDLKELCKKLKPVVGAKADALWMAYVTAETPEAKRQTEALIQMVAARHLTNHVDDTKILLPPPSRELADGEFPLGTVLYGKSELFPLALRPENLQKHVGIFSITGGGKTNVAQVLLLGLLEKNVPFLVIDWKRSYRSLRALNRPNAKNLRVFTVGRKSASMFQWNPLRGPPGVHPKTWISAVAEALEKSHISGPGVADVLIEVLDKKFADTDLYHGIPDQYPNFFDAKQELERVRFSGRKMLWRDSALRIINTFVFGPAAGAFNARNPIKLEELLERPVVLELDQELPKPLRVFLNDIFLRWIHLFRLGQGETDALRHVTVLEEVHNLFPKSQIEKQATNSLETVFREIRSFGEGLVNITQHPSLLPIYVLGNCNSLIFLGLQHDEDIVAAQRALFLPRGDAVFLDRLAVGEGIVKIKGRVDPCYVKFPLVPVLRGAVTDDAIGEGGDDAAEAGLD